MANKGNEEVSLRIARRCVQARDQRDAASRPTNKQGADRVTEMCNRSKPTRKRERRSSNDKLTTTNKRNKEGRVGGVRDANDRSERRDIWPGARGKGRVREQAQTERAREQQQRERRGKRAVAARGRGKNRGRTFPPKSHRAPRLSSRQTPNNKVNIAHGTIMPFDLVSSSRYAFNHTGGSR